MKKRLFYVLLLALMAGMSSCESVRYVQVPADCKVWSWNDRCPECGLKLKDHVPVNTKYGIIGLLGPGGGAKHYH